MRRLPTGDVVGLQHIGAGMRQLKIHKKLMDLPASKPATSREVDPQNQVMVNRITNALKSRTRFFLQMKVLWSQVVGAGKADYEQMEEWIERVEEEIEIPKHCFGDLGITYFAYDFNGDGKLDFLEGFRLLKHALEKYRRSLGGHPEIQVPTKTPEEAGYTVVRVLAAGGQGTANLATDRDGEQKVLKVYDKSQQNAGTIDDLIDESEVMSKGRGNPNIAAIVEIFQDSRFMYMVGIPYMGGDFESLQKKTAEAGVDMDEDWYRGIFYQGFSALDYLHRKSIVHCDIKEANMMIKYPEYEQPDVVIIDLGLATSHLQGGQAVKGTPGYMPPETWEYGLWFPRGDVFSMGVVCIQMLTGNVPDHKNGKAGIFQKGSSIDEVRYYTQTLNPPYDDMDPYSDDIMDWLPQCLDKDFKTRSKPHQVIMNDWFSSEMPLLRRCLYC